MQGYAKHINRLIFFFDKYISKTNTKKKKKKKKKKKTSRSVFILKPCKQRGYRFGGKSQLGGNKLVRNLEIFSMNCKIIIILTMTIINLIFV